jgi:hypothetical protein
LPSGTVRQARDHLVVIATRPEDIDVHRCPVLAQCEEVGGFRDAAKIPGTFGIEQVEFG